LARLLTICPYSLLPLRGGGGLRCFHLLRQLARFHEVHAIVFQREAELRRETEGYKIPAQVQLYSPIDSPPPSGLFSRLPRKLRMALHYRWLRRSWRGPADAILLRSHHLIAQILPRQKIDAVVFEHLSSMRAAPLVRRLSRPTRAVLDAHNVDHRLMAQEFSQAGTRELTRQERKLVERTRWEERHLRSSVDAIWCCSEEARRLLTAPNRIAGYTIPNGVDCSFFQFDERPSKAEAPWLIFSGALQTEANKNAVRWIIGEIWPGCASTATIFTCSWWAAGCRQIWLPQRLPCRGLKWRERCPRSAHSFARHRSPSCLSVSAAARG